MSARVRSVSPHPGNRGLRRRARREIVTERRALARARDRRIHDWMPSVRRRVARSQMAARVAGAYRAPDGDAAK